MSYPGVGGRALELKGAFRIDSINHIATFRGIPYGQLQQLLRGSEVLTQKTGQKLFCEGQNANFFGYVLSGAYKLSHLNTNGEEIIMHFGVQGEPLAIMATMETPCKFPFDATAMGDSHFLKIPRQNFFESWIYNPTVMKRYQNDLQGRIFLQHDEKSLQRRPLNERIANLLIYLSEHKSTRLGSIELVVTRREIAAYVGATVESVIRVMSKWSQEKIIETSDRFIEIRCRKKLLEQGSMLPPTRRSAEFSKLETRLSSLWRTTGITLQHQLNGSVHKVFSKYLTPKHFSPSKKRPSEITNFCLKDPQSPLDPSPHPQSDLKVCHLCPKQ